MTTQEMRFRLVEYPRLPRPHVPTPRESHCVPPVPVRGLLCDLVSDLKPSLK